MTKLREGTGPSNNLHPGSAPAEGGLVPKMAAPVSTPKAPSLPKIYKVNIPMMSRPGGISSQSTTGRTPHQYNTNNAGNFPHANPVRTPHQYNVGTPANAFNPPPAAGGGGGGGGEGLTSTVPIEEVKWNAFGGDYPNAPSWWRPMAPSVVNDATEYMAVMNMMIPYLSPEDQRTVVSNLYQMDAKNFGHLDPSKIDWNIPWNLNQGISFKDQGPKDQGENMSYPTTGGRNYQQYFTSQLRASDAVEALRALAKQSGKSEKDMGAGFRYLQTLLDAGKSFGSLNPKTGENQTRRQQLQYMGAVDPLLSQSSSAGSSLGAFGPLAQMLANPFFTAGQLMPLTKNQDGTYTFGNQNKELL